MTCSKSTSFIHHPDCLFAFPLTDKVASSPLKPSPTWGPTTSCFPTCLNQELRRRPWPTNHSLDRKLCNRTSTSFSPTLCVTCTFISLDKNNPPQKIVKQNTLKLPPFSSQIGITVWKFNQMWLQKNPPKYSFLSWWTDYLLIPGSLHFSLLLFWDMKEKTCKLARSSTSVSLPIPCL